MIASIFCAAISRFAFSMRARRSSAVIGLARSRIDVNAAMLAGSGPGGSGAPRLRWADTRVIGTAAAARLRKVRRETMVTPCSRREIEIAMILCRRRRRQRNLQDFFERVGRDELHVCLHF